MDGYLVDDNGVRVASAVFDDDRGGTFKPLDSGFLRPGGRYILRAEDERTFHVVIDKVRLRFKMAHGYESVSGTFEVEGPPPPPRKRFPYDFVHGDEDASTDNP